MAREETYDALLDRTTELERRIGALEAQEALHPDLRLLDGVSVPTTEAGIATMYIDTADGDLKIKFGDGTVKTIVVDT